MLSDIEIAQSAKMLPITEIAEKLDILPEELELYGRYKAKLSEDIFARLQDKPDGKLVLVTAINPTPAGEGKTTTSVGLGQAMARIGEKAVIALREPSLGPVFGIKGGAAGGGYSQVIPMEDINLHFTGDMHAITAANNLLCAMIDNHLQQGNLLGIDQRRILFKRCLDMNDRALRFVNVGLGGKINGVPREDGFQITVASEVMAILCLAADLDDLKERLGSILIAYTYDNKPVYARDLKVHGAMAALLKDALKPNLVQTLENTPALMHGGPFANIAHGCNSVRATKLALKMADYCITEAGFGSDLGAEKFLDIKCRYAGLAPSAIVIVATLRALKYNGGVPKAEVAAENVEALKKGLVNLEAHVENMRKYGVPVVVAINRFLTDTDQEIEVLAECCRRLGVEYSLSEAFAKGGEGAVDLAHKVVEACSAAIPIQASLRRKGADQRKNQNHRHRNLRRRRCLLCPESGKIHSTILRRWEKRTCPSVWLKPSTRCPMTRQNWDVPPDLPSMCGMCTLSAGAGFIVVMSGDIMTMPGLPKAPAACQIDVDSRGHIKGLF